LEDLHRLSNSSPLDGIRYYFNRRSFLYHTLRRIRASIKYRKYVDIARVNLVRRDNRLNVVNPFIVHKAKEVSRQISNSLLLKGQKTRELWRIFEKEIADMARIAQGNDATFVLVVIPDPVQVDKKYEETYKSLGVEVSPDVIESDILQGAIGAFAAQEGIILLDLLPHFKRIDEDLYLDNDPHMNRRGGLLAIDILIEFLRDNGIIKNS
jgi:hypothetical protein